MKQSIQQLRAKLLEEIETNKKPLEQKDKKQLREEELTVGVDKSRAHQPAHFVYNSKTGQKKYFKTKEEAEKYLKDKKLKEGLGNSENKKSNMKQSIQQLRVKLLQEIEEAGMCKECGAMMERGMCTECGWMEEKVSFTDKYNDDPKLTRGQKELPDQVQQHIVKKEAFGDQKVDAKKIADKMRQSGIMSMQAHADDVAKMGMVSATELDAMLPSYVSGAEITKLFDQGVTEGAEDHEVSMAKNSLEQIIATAQELMMKMGDEERNIPGWIQDHITNAENYIHQASKNFHELEGNSHSQDMPPLPEEEAAFFESIIKGMLKEANSKKLSKKKKNK